MKLVSRVCPHCGSSEAATEYSSGEYRVVKCGQCGFAYLPVAATLDHYVEGDGAWEHSRRKFTEQRLKKMPLQTRLSTLTRWRTKFLKKSPAQYIERFFAGRNGSGHIHVLDIGCGMGTYLAPLGDRYVPYGIEISRGLAAVSQENFAARGGHVVNAATVDALGEFKPGSMDAVVMRAYLEHESEPLAVLKACRAVIRDGGLVVVMVPNYGSVNRLAMGANWCGFRFPDHVNYFTPGTLAAMAAKAGFGCRQRLADKLPTNDNMWAVLTPIRQ